MLAHVDLFSGIGGFTLAAHANGLQTVCFCEIDQRCRDFLSKAWPGIDIHDDIRTFDGTKYNGSFLLTAGVPCQPASRAGELAKAQGCGRGCYAADRDASQGDVADGKSLNNEWTKQERNRKWQSENEIGNRISKQWNDFVWLPCADGKVRRAPDDSVELVDGLRRSVLAALGNSIVWPVAAEIVRAIMEASDVRNS